MRLRIARQRRRAALYLKRAGEPPTGDKGVRWGGEKERAQLGQRLAGLRRAEPPQRRDLPHVVHAEPPSSHMRANTDNVLVSTEERIRSAERGMGLRGHEDIGHLPAPVAEA